MLFTSERRQNRISYEQSGLPVCYRPTVANQEISQISEEAVPDNTKKAIKFGLAIFTGKALICLINRNMYQYLLLPT